jgi:hypothetical protein
MDINPETIRDYLPYYLTEQDKVGIANELKNFHLDKMQYYLISEFQQEMRKNINKRGYTFQYV